jgi:hypothetical protein
LHEMVKEQNDHDCHTGLLGEGTRDKRGSLSLPTFTLYLQYTSTKSRACDRVSVHERERERDREREREAGFWHMLERTG